MKQFRFLAVGLAPLTFIILVWLLTFGSFNIVIAVQSDAMIVATGFALIIALILTVIEFNQSNKPTKH